LERWAQSRTLPAGDVFRARLILALAAGKSYREIESGMQTSAATIARWRVRFERDGVAGLESRHRGSRPRTATATVQARVVRRVQQKPNDGSTHWSCRKLAQELGLSKSTVQRILTQAHLKRSTAKSAQVLDGRDARSHTHLPEMDFGEINEQRLEP